MVRDTLEVGARWREVAPAWAPASAAQLRALRGRMRRIADVLGAACGTPTDSFCNRPDPLDEAIYILITYQTDLARAREVWMALRAHFATWADALRARPSSLESVLRPAGFQRNRARIVRAMLEAVQATFGSLTLEPLRAMSTAQAERVLRRLPGLDIKGARCVLMYSLDRKVFPVDSNTFRFMERYGVLRPGARYRRRTTHDELQTLVAPRDRLRLHVNLLVHGQKTCVPGVPRCDACPVRRTCATGRVRTKRTS